MTKGTQRKKNNLPKIATEKSFCKAIENFRKKEKQLTRDRDKLSAQRRRLPMMEVSNHKLFEGPGGKKSLFELFEGRRQLVVYHFMYHPKTNEFCRGCSFVADHIPHLAHLHARNTSLVMTSHAPVKSIRAHQKRLGWTTPWYSCVKNNFNEELNIDGNREPVLSVFLREGQKIYRTYYTGARGLEYLGTPWAFLDLTPWGRQENWENSPVGWPQTPPYEWWRYHDEYLKK